MKDKLTGLSVVLLAIPLLFSADSIRTDAAPDSPDIVTVAGKDWSMECIRALNDDNVALMVILMGTDGGGKTLIYDEWWAQRARKYNMGLVAVDFHADLATQALDKGHLSLLDGAYLEFLRVVRQSLDEITGKRIIFYGFSAGSRFLHRFLGNENVGIVSFLSGHQHLGVLYAPGWLDETMITQAEGMYVFAVGELDFDRWYEVWSGYCGYRKSGKTSMWKEVPASGHVWSRTLDEFVWACAGAMVNGDLTVSPRALSGQLISEQSVATDPMISLDLGRKVAP